MQQASNYQRSLTPLLPYLVIALCWNGCLHVQLSFEPADIDGLHASSEFVYATDPRTNEFGHRLSLVPTLSYLALAAAYLHITSDERRTLWCCFEEYTYPWTTRATPVTPTRPTTIKAAASTHTSYAHTCQRRASTTVRTATATLLGAVDLLSVMSLATSKTFDPILPFKHAPLDHTQPSIRIIKVLPSLSPEGFVQCVLTHGNTTDDYTCLSYTWGDESTSYPILVDGQSFFVRQNLHSFLHVVRERYPLRPFWIDAVCIDQGSIAERNHQVAQMGAIYAAAVHVMIWLGNNPKIAEFFRAWNEHSQHESRISWCMSARDHFKRVVAGWVELANHAYWSRAWITQEIAHSRALSMLADVVEIYNFQYISRIPWAGAATFDERFPVQINIARHHHTILGKTLSSLLERLPHQECQNPRDQVYALLGLAAEGAAICVDYGSSNLSFALTLFKASAEVACLCGIIRLSGILGNLEEMAAQASIETHFVQLTLPLISKFNIPHRKQSWDQGSQNDGPQLNRPDIVLFFEMYNICPSQPRDLMLEVLDSVDNGVRQQICRFAQLFSTRPSSYPYENGIDWRLHHGIHQYSLQWGQRSSEHCLGRMHYHHDSRSWQPHIGVRSQARLCWAFQSSPPKMFSNWFRADLQTVDANVRDMCTLRVPMAVLMSYAQQSIALKNLAGQFKSASTTINRRRCWWDDRNHGWQCRLARNGTGAFMTIQKDQDS